MTQTEISGISPFFIVRHVPTSLAFYRDKFGFEITFQIPTHWQPNLHRVTFTFFEPLADTDDGLRGFEVQDADGYVLFFGRTR